MSVIWSFAGALMMSDEIERVTRTAKWLALTCADPALLVADGGALPETFVEPSAACGYKRQPLDRDQWRREGIRVVYGERVPFSFEDGPGIIYGGFLMTDTGEALWCSRLEFPVDMRGPGPGKFSLTPCIELRMFSRQ